MTIAFRLYVVLVALSPLTLITDDLFVRGALTGCTALVLTIVGITIRPGEAAFLFNFLRPVAVVSAPVALWIMIQALPLPFTAIQHPIWSSAQTALDTTLWGSISISPGATVIAAARYFTAFGLLFATAAMTVDRRRAEALLLVLAGITTLLAAILIVHDLGGFFFLGPISTAGPHATIIAAANLGTILTATTVVYAIERFETRHSRPDFSYYSFWVTLTAAATAFCLCWFAVGLFASTASVFAAATGLGTFVLTVGFRRLEFGPRMGYVLALVAAAVPLALISRELLSATTHITLRFNTSEGDSAITLAERIIADTNWAGSGAGTFSALVPIYAGSISEYVGSVVPTTAAGAVIELGPVVLWICVVAAIAVVIWFLKGALRRGRDSFFPAAGASAGVVLLIEAFYDSSLFASATIAISTSILGLALSQSVSRTSRQLN